MQEKPSRRIAVVFERVPVSHRWASHEWRLLDAIPDVGGEARVLVEREGLLQRIHPGLVVTLHRDEAEGYYLNVSTGDPCVFVSVRADEESGDPVPFLATASYNEAARWMDGGEQVERAGIDADFAAWLGAWVEANYRPEPKERVRPKSFKGREGRLRERG